MSSRREGSNPCAINAVTVGAKAIPMSARTAVASSSSPRIVPASARAARLSLCSNAAYTGMNEAESVPSPSRLRSALGIRSAARNASAAAPLPK